MDERNGWATRAPLGICWHPSRGHSWDASPIPCGKNSKIVQQLACRLYYLYYRAVEAITASNLSTLLILTLYGSLHIDTCSSQNWTDRSLLNIFWKERRCSSKGTMRKFQNYSNWVEYCFIHSFEVKETVLQNSFHFITARVNRYLEVGKITTYISSNHKKWSLG